MGNIALPALSIRPPEQPDPLAAYGKLMQFRAMAQERQLRDQQIQGATLENQQRQRQMQSAQAMQSLFPKFVQRDQAGKPTGYDYDGLMSAAGAAGVDPGTLEHLQTMRKSAADTVLTEVNTKKNTLEQQQALLAQSFQRLEGIRGVQDPNQRQQAWTAALQWGQQNGSDVSKLPPQVPDDKGLDAIEAAMGMHAQSIADLKARAEVTKAQNEAQSTGSEAQIKAAEAASLSQGGMTQQMADSKYRIIQQKPQKMWSPQEQAFVKAYEKQKTLNTQVRVEAMGQQREYPVIDTKSGSLQYLSATDLNKANQETPGRYAPAGEGAKAMGKTALIEDIRGNIKSVRESLQNEKMPEFSASQRAEVALAIGSPDAQGALSAAFRGNVLGSLSPEQQDYLIKMAQLKENAMAMRSVLGAGQGSEDMRAAITATIPGPRTPSKGYALKQLDQFEAVLNRLERGVPNVPLRPEVKQPTTPVFDWNAHPKVQ